MSSRGEAPRSLDPESVRYGPGGLVAAVVQDVEDGRVLMVAWQDAQAVEATLRTGEAHFHSRSRNALWRKGETSGNTLSVDSLELDCDGDAVLIRARPAGPTCHTEARSCFDLAPGEPAAVSHGQAPGDGAVPGVPAPGDEPSAGDGPASGVEPTAGDEPTAGVPASGAASDDDVSSQGFAWLERLWVTISERAATRPTGSYTTRLLEGGVDAVSRKVAEEATEVVLAAKDDAVAGVVDEGRTRTALAGELADLLYHALVLCAERDLAPREVISALEARHKP